MGIRAALKVRIDGAAADIARRTAHVEATVAAAGRRSRLAAALVGGKARGRTDLIVITAPPGLVLG
ncbi:hypothetical protein ACFYTS_14025 [Nocardia sp. NPDC004151]|uniref:hypothetical protein n=1 Tax=Nocardia sp. NPDC004151 TaxID=3364304 RepID=UPI00367995D5